jgi:hypothetical protein
MYVLKFIATNWRSAANVIVPRHCSIRSRRGTQCSPSFCCPFWISGRSWTWCSVRSHQRKIESTRNQRSVCLPQELLHILGTLHSVL